MVLKGHLYKASNPFEGFPHLKTSPACWLKCHFRTIDGAPEGLLHVPLRGAGESGGQIQGPAAGASEARVSRGQFGWSVCLRLGTPFLGNYGVPHKKRSTH